MSNILSIAPYRFLPPASGGHLAVILSDKVLSKFNKVDTLTTDNNDVGGGKYPFTVHPVFSSSKWRYLPGSQYRKVMAVAKTTAPDYLSCHHHYMYFMARKAARNLKIPLYIRSHNIEAERFKSIGKWWWRIMRWFERTAYRGADAVFFLTEEDRDWAIQHYGIEKDKGVIMPLGIDFDRTPVVAGNSKTKLAEEYQLDSSVPWLFFMGQLDYAPNAEAVRYLVRDILPLLRQEGMPFHMIICGKKLAEELQQEIAGTPDTRYLGFVPEIEPLIASCDLMLNPVVSGGGVKTKVVESLAWNRTVVSAYSGALGVAQEVCGEKLHVVPDGDWQQFATTVRRVLAQPSGNIPDAFFDYYYSKNIAARVQQYFQ